VVRFHLAPLMKRVRRALMALGLAGLAGWLLHLRGKGGTPPAGTGWRQLQGPDFR
jgi:hypothetical protein